MMMRKPIARRIAELEERKKSLVARLGKQERARDTRRKLLLGSLVLHHHAQSGDTEFMRQLTEWLRQNLPGFLTRDHDRDLFDDFFGPAISPASASSSSLASSTSPVPDAAQLPDGTSTENRE
jgi:hypothetical protein